MAAGSLFCYSPSPTQRRLSPTLFPPLLRGVKPFLLPLPSHTSISLNNLCFSPATSIRRRFSCKPPCALDSDRSISLKKFDSNYRGLMEWDSLTARFAGAANVPFLLMQLPQIILNARNLSAGNNFALFAIPWLGVLTALLGNLSLLSYFATKKETEAALVQTLGVVSTYIVIAQLAMAEAMPLPHFTATSVVVATGLVLNFLNYSNLLHDDVWELWENFTTIGGLSVLPQVMWSTFVPFIPNSILPGMVAFTAAVVAVVMARTGMLSEKGVKFVGSLSGWTATLLFMWMPVAQMWTNFLNPDNIKGLSALTLLLAMMGNGLMIPRALFVRDLMWFAGSTWATFLHGWGNLVCVYCFNSVSKEFFSAATLGLFIWLGMTLWRDRKAHGYISPMKSLKELVGFGP